MSRIGLSFSKLTMEFQIKNNENENDNNNDNDDDIWNDESNDIVIASNDINAMIASMRQSGYRQGCHHIIIVVS